MSITNYLPNFDFSNREIDSMESANAVLKECTARDTRKKIAFVCLTLFCALSLLRAKPELLGRFRAYTKLTRAVQYTALAAGLIYLSEIVGRLWQRPEIRLESGYKNDSIDEETHKKIAQYVTHLDLWLDYSEITEGLKKYTSVRKLSLHLQSVEDTPFSKEVMQFFQSVELDINHFVSPIDGEPLKDFSWLNNFPPLKGVCFRHNGFSDKFMKDLEKHKNSLELLDVGYTSIGELPGLKEFTNLKSVGITGSGCTSIKNLPPSIEFLDYGTHDDIDLKPLKNLPRLKVIGGMMSSEQTEKIEQYAPQAKIEFLYNLQI